MYYIYSSTGMIPSAGRLGMAWESRAGGAEGFCFWERHGVVGRGRLCDRRCFTVR